MTIAITPLPTPPSRADSANFSARGDAFLAALPLLQTEANAQNAENNAHNANINAQVAAALAAGLANAATNAAAAAANATTASAQNTAAGTSASAAATSAAAAAVARDLSIAAWSASTAPAEVLAARSQSLHVGAIVKAIVYDTSKDSDGGAWRQRCQDKSWYTEALGGSRWIGQEATIAAAWADAGSTTGAVFQASATAGPLTVGKFYTATSATTATEVFRGVTRDFPAVAGIVAESSRVVIYDLSMGAMWMVFVGANFGYWRSNRGGIPSIGPSVAIPPLLSSVAMSHGLLTVAAPFSDGGINSGLFGFFFISEDEFSAHSLIYGRGSCNVGIANRNTPRYRCNSTKYDYGLLTSIVNDVAITVLDNAPIDPATGLPVPTIAVATAGGVSVIRDNGVVVNDTSLSGAPASFVYFTKENRLVRNWTNDYNRPCGVLKAGIPSASSSSDAVYDIFGSTVLGLIPAYPLIGISGAATSVASNKSVSTSRGLVLVERNPSDRTKTMVAAITNAYNSGWQVGDSRGAWLADTVVETVTAPELAVSGTFDTDVNSAGFAAMYPVWTAPAAIGLNGGAILSVVAGAIRVTNDGTGVNYGFASLMVPTIAGKTYIFSFTRVGGTGIGGAHLFSAGERSGTIVINLLNGITFVAPTTTTYISLNSGSTVAGQYYDFDNISVKLAEPDRSVKNNGLNIVGTLTKTAVAAAAQLVAYSGFSAANYLEQPYNSQLDFGTGDFCVMGWVKPVNGGDNTIIYRGVDTSLASPVAGMNIFVAGATADTCLFKTLIGGIGRNSVAAIPFASHSFAVVARVSGVLSIYLNGLFDVSVAHTASVSLASGSLLVGKGFYSGTNQANLALWRISATAPSADQIAHIYRSELPLFQAGAQCTIAGTSTAVTALAYDDATDLLHVGTSWGRTGFRDLLRVDSEATTTGALTSLSAQGGTILTGGTSAKLYVPAKYLRDELQRREVARKALGSIPVFMDYDAIGFTAALTNASTTLTASAVSGTPYVGMGITGTGIVQGTVITSISGATYTISIAATATASNAVAQASFALPPGYTYKAVYSAGVLKRLGSNKDYTIATDGYKETINFNISPGSTAWVSIMAIKG